MGYKVAVVGATGNVGREMLDILAERNFPADEVVAVASRRSQGVECSFGDKTLKVKALDHFDFSDVDICLMSAGGAVSKEWSPKIAAQGAVVIDNSSAWRMDPDVPLIVPEVNADAVTGFTKKNIIANPNCSTAQLVVALKPLHDKAKIKRVVVATYQSVSGAGKDAMDELFSQTKAVFTLDEVETKKFPKRIAFNVIPHIDVFMEDGYTKEEWKMVVETKKILDPKIKLTATCVRVPVFVGHSEAVNIEFENPITADEAREILRNAPGLPGDRQARAGRLRHALRVCRRGRDLHQPHPRGRDDRERPADVGRVRQSAQGRGAECGADRRVPDQSQAYPGQAPAQHRPSQQASEARLREHPRMIVGCDLHELLGRRDRAPKAGPSRRRNRRHARGPARVRSAMRRRGNVIRLSMLLTTFACSSRVRYSSRDSVPRGPSFSAAGDISFIQLPMKSPGESGSASSANAFTPPHCACPSTTMCLTFSAPTPNSSAADTPWACPSGA